MRHCYTLLGEVVAAAATVAAHNLDNAAADVVAAHDRGVGAAAGADAAANTPLTVEHWRTVVERLLRRVPPKWEETSMPRTNLGTALHDVPSYGDHRK